MIALSRRARRLVGVLAGAREFPEHHRAGADLDQLVRAEPGEGDGVGPKGGDHEYADADHVQTRVAPSSFRPPASAQEPVGAGGAGGMGHVAILAADPRRVVFRIRLLGR